jgi:hypothetical protein
LPVRTGCRVRRKGRTALDVSGQYTTLDVHRLDRGEYRLVRRASRSNEGVLDWLLSCPEKDFFVPLASESTNTL